MILLHIVEVLSFKSRCSTVLLSLLLHFEECLKFAFVFFFHPQEKDILVDITVINEKDPVPAGYVCLEYTQDTREFVQVTSQPKFSERALSAA